MRNGEGSWRISVRTSSPVIDCALWIRAAERIEVPDDPLVPGPLDVDRIPAPTVRADQALGEEWLDWWRSLVDAPDSRTRPVADPAPEPAFDTPDPLGLAWCPTLREVVARRWEEANQARQERPRREPSPVVGQVVREVEAELGCPARPFGAEFTLLPVRDDVIRWVEDHRYLVPARIYGGPQWTEWLRDLVSRIA